MKNFIPKLILLLILFPAAVTAQVPKLSSLPTAAATMYLDFDGQTVQSGGWNGGAAFYCQAPPFTANQISEMFARVSEDYRPFDINVTTDSTKFLAAPLNKRMRIIITTSSAWYPSNVGGICYVGSFTWGDNTPAFVFSDKLANAPKYVAECITHESGHSVGLSHQSRWNENCALTETYNVGNGSGETSWAPVMGNSYYRNMTGWNDGPTPFGCTNTQDNLTIITTTNGFSYRADDYTETRNTSTYALGSTFSVNGLIATNSDKDAFKYTLAQTSKIHLEATPYSIGNNVGANLDVTLSIYNGSTLVRTYNPSGVLNASLDTTLNAGTYYMVVSGGGNENTDNYGSLGSYTFTGFFGALPIRDVKLAGTVDKNKHNLSWNIIADEPIKTQVIEVSSDGITFKPLSAINPLQNTFLYSTNQGVTLFYRLKVISVIDETAYSNIVALKSSGSAKSFDVATLVRDAITVNAPENFKYRLSDANGRAVAQGNGTKGLNRINVERLPGAMYILQLINENQSQTERIIKQ